MALWTLRVCNNWTPIGVTDPKELTTVITEEVRELIYTLYILRDDKTTAIHFFKCSMNSYMYNISPSTIP